LGDAAWDEGAVTRLLDREGYTHIMINRVILPGNWDTLLGVDDGFLRHTTALVGAAHNVYLYRILPPEQRGAANTWTRGPELLPNGGFEVERAGGPDGWMPLGAPVFDTGGRWGRQGRGAVRGDPTSAYVTRVPVRPETPYLLTHATRAADERGLVRLQINWHDAADALTGVSIEVVPASRLGYHAWSMLATSPPGTAVAEVFVQAQAGTIWFDDVSLREAALP
jgi:hypothetical protein